MIIETVLSVPIEFLGLLAQDVAAAPDGGAAGAAAEGAAQNPGGLAVLFQNPLLPVGILFFLFYFIVLLPERKRKRSEQQMRAQISKNDRVIIAGGIHGVVVSAIPQSPVVTVRIDDKQNVRIRVNRSSVFRVDGGDETEQTDSEHDDG